LNLSCPGITVDEKQFEGNSPGSQLAYNAIPMAPTSVGIVELSKYALMTIPSLLTTAGVVKEKKISSVKLTVEHTLVGTVEAVAPLVSPSVTITFASL
jgi:hypothetical protein